MTPNLERNPLPPSFTTDMQPPAMLWPAWSQNRDPGSHKPAFAGAPDAAEPAATRGGWPRVFPGL
jgi:hypothetical protein